MNLDPRIAADLNAIYERLDNEGELLSNARLDAVFQIFRDKFGPGKLQSLDGEDLLLTMHSRGDRNSLMYWLEFKNDEEFAGRFLGSIAGGSAHKFGVFYSQIKSAWMSGSAQKMREISLSEAIDIARRQRDELLAGCKFLMNLPVNASDQEYNVLQKEMNNAAPPVGDSGWGHKYFSLLFPDKLDNFHNSYYQRHHLIRLLQTPPEGNDRYVCGGRFVAIAKELKMRMSHLTQAINARDGRSPYQYWYMEDNTSYPEVGRWEQMKTGDYIAIGSNTCDLSEIRKNPNNTERKAAIKQSILQKYPTEEYPTLQMGVGIQFADQFAVSIKQSDIVIFVRQAGSKKEVLGIGYVTGQYYYVSDEEEPHRLPVDWLSLEKWDLPTEEYGRTRIHKSGKYPVNLIEVERHMGRQDHIR